MTKLRILGRANSFNVRKVLWVCDELGIDYTREDWGRGFRPTTEAEFLQLNPIGLVPAVIDEGHVLRESNTIVRYLTSKHGAVALYPTDLLQRARVEQWMDWANYETSISVRGPFLGGMLNEPPWNHGSSSRLYFNSLGAKSLRSRRQVCHSWSVPGDS